jgi:hypothetical protein
MDQEIWDLCIDCRLLQVVHRLYAAEGDAVPLVSEAFPDAVVDQGACLPE